MNQDNKPNNSESIVLTDLAFRIPWGPTGYYQEGRDLFYKRVSVNHSSELRNEKDIFGRITLENLSIGSYQDWKYHFAEQEGGLMVPPLPLWVALTERLYEEKHQDLDKLIKDFREEGFSTATIMRYAGSHVVHYLGTDQIRVHCYVPPSSILDSGLLVYEQVRDREAWRNVFRALLLSPDVDKTMGILQEVYGKVAFNSFSGVDERAYTVPVRIHSHAFGGGFEINAVPSSCSRSDLHRVRGVQLEKLCLVQEVA